MLSRKVTTFLLSIIFFTMGLITLPNYGINWDTINHLPRGQAYLNYLLTGDKDYSNLPKWVNHWQNPETLFISTNIPKDEFNRRSLYQFEGYDYNRYATRDGYGHPPLSDIFSSVFNRVFYQKLGLVNDIDSYRMYGVFLAASLVGLVYWWVSSKYGAFAGLVAAFSLSLYPLFWSESHFNNEKDIPETVFWSFMLFAFWKGIIQSKPKWLLLSGVFFGFALGTKFNILFSAFVVLPWLFFYLVKKNNRKLFTKKTMLASMAIAPIIGVSIFVFFWPYLWADPLARAQQVIAFYRDIGLSASIDQRFVGPFSINTYPILWIVFTTPPFTLLLFVVGLAATIKLALKDKDNFAFLVLLWLSVPIARVVWPGTHIYGGIRQIMEYVPAMAIIAGIGGLKTRNFLISKINRKTIINVLILLLFLPNLFTLIKIHPNENVYFNFLIGGLKGAKANDFPAWGNSFGAAYRQGMNWLNKNADQDARIVYANELIPNIPRTFFRPDLELHNKYRSGPAKEGEYAITLTHYGTGERTFYDSYLERLLEPVYSVDVDGVSILKIWKNDNLHTKKGYLKEELIKDVGVVKNDLGFIIDLSKPLVVSRVEGKFESNNCNQLISAFSRVSVDGVSWRRPPGTMPGENWRTSAFGTQPTENMFIQPFAAEKARYIEYIVIPLDACFLNIKSVNVAHLPDL